MRDIRRIDLNLLAVFHVLMEERNVTRAARRLGLTQPTVSAALGRLRKLFGDPLFVRDRRGIEPTPRALAVAPGVELWIGQARSLLANPTFDPQTAELTASISANDYLQSSLIVPFIHQLRKESANTRVAVRSANLSEAPTLLARGELDICVTSGPEIPSPTLAYRLLYREHYVCAVRKEHPLRGKAVTLEQFCKFEHVLVSPNDGAFAGPTDLALSSVGMHRRVALSLSSFFTLPDVLKGDDLIAVVPKRFLLGRMAGLRAFPPPVDIPEFDVVALWHPRQQNDASHRWLRRLLAKTAESLATKG
jgi:DNA-binding transcriptional LysR family regulator